MGNHQSILHFRCIGSACGKLEQTFIFSIWSIKDNCDVGAETRQMITSVEIHLLMSHNFLTNAQE